MHNKLLAIWQDGYIQSGEGTNFVWNYWPEYENSVRTGDSYLDGEFSTNFASIQGGLPEYHEGFLKGTADAGRWMKLVFHVKVSSTNTTPDGKAVAWRRWDGDSEFTKISDWTGIVKTPTNGPDGFKAGYLLGWASAGIAVQTEFQIDNFTLSTTSLITNLTTPRPPTNTHVAD